ncbi:MAG: deoxyribodipyrimidine photolyase [Cyanobacteria bacterium]|jgi:deoxyribodipyrimidine photo-lyase|nr:deoxyribodipyrimidine photolyase [Cyanobacteria bacterium GSL.Bin21]
MTNLILFWHRRDLRLDDNIGLDQAQQQAQKVVGIFCFDPKLLQSDQVAPARIKYLLGCLKELQTRYQKVGSDLLFLQADPVTAIPELATTLKATAIFWNNDVEPYGRERDRAVQSALQAKNIPVHTFWDQLLHAPGEILTQGEDPYKVYTPFWKNWQQQPKAEPVGQIQQLTGLTDSEQARTATVGTISLPTLKDLGVTWDNELPLPPGETAARERLEQFCDRAILDYDQNRNYPAVDGTSVLSAALKFGAIGIREVWKTTAIIWEDARSDEARENINAWRQELAWREFYQHALYFFPELADGPYRDQFKDFPWDNNPEHFQAWCEGKTGYPIVDAAMRQLNTTGWMHNRCRMIVASFLTKDLIINWQWGEQYFMQTLFDGDLAANNGGWQWSASSGMDPKPLRIFNPASQAQKFDPDGEYIRYWLPELNAVDTGDLLTGNISPIERETLGYTQPIVDHKQQQRTFKQLYQQQKKQS